MRRAACFAIALALTACMASAAETPNQSELKLPPYSVPSGDAGFDLPKLPVPTATAPGGGSFRLRGIAFRGNAAIPTADLEQLAAPWLAEPVSPADIELLRQRISRLYVDRGYLNSGALLAPGALDGEVLTIDIVEGRLTGVVLHGLGRLDESYVTRRLLPDPSAPLNVDALRERFQLLLDDPLFERLNARLQPGVRAGEALLDIEATRARPWGAGITLNNYRSPSIGEAAATVSGWVRNLSGQGDLLEASLQAAADGLHDGRASLGWQMPLGQRGTRLQLQFDHGRSALQEEPVRALDIRSTLDSRSVGISHALVDSLRHRLVLGVDRNWRENRTWLLGEPFSFVPGEPDGRTRVAATRLWLEYAWRTERAVLAWRTTLSAASTNLQPVTGLPPGASAPDHDYRTRLVQAHYARQMGEDGGQLIVRASLQRTGQHVIALDQFSLGGIATVRGFRENQLVRDEGEVLSLEYEQPVSLGRIVERGKLSVAPFIDAGRGSNRGGAADTLSSAGVALHWRWQAFSLDLALAKRLSAQPAADARGNAWQDRGIHLQFGYHP